MLCHVAAHVDFVLQNSTARCTNIDFQSTYFNNLYALVHAVWLCDLLKVRMLSNLSNFHNLFVYSVGGDIDVITLIDSLPLSTEISLTFVKQQAI